MKRYLNKSQKSGIEAYELGVDHIRVKFKDQTIYLYTNDNNGASVIEKMKKLAQDGIGLNTFINKHIRSNYAQKEQ